MSNELTTRNNTNVATPASGNPFLQAASSLGGDGNGVFIKFSGKTGEYTYGADQEELELQWRGAVNIALTAKLGAICWKDGEVVGESMTLVMQGTPTPISQLPDHGPYEDDEDGWSEQFSVELVEMETGEQMLLKNSSKSGLRAFGSLLNSYGKALQKGLNIGENGEELIPVVEFDATEFTPKGAKKREKAYAPKFTIVDWISDAELQEKFGGEDDASNYEEEEEEKVPAKTSSKSVKEEAQETEEESAPATTGRRRRTF